MLPLTTNSALFLHFSFASGGDRHGNKTTKRRYIPLIKSRFSFFLVNVFVSTFLALKPCG